MHRDRLIVLAVLAVSAALAATACGGSDSGGGDSAAVTVRAVGGQPEGGIQTIEAKKGGTVHFTVESDEAGTAHVHGYDIEQEVGPGQPTVFDFEATLDGIFDVELHRGSHATGLAELRIEP